jgi:hypothetical protein
MPTIDVPLLHHLTTVSTLFAHREHRITSTDTVALERMPAIEYSEIGEELSELANDVDEVDPEDEYSIFGCGKASASWVLR